MVLPMSDELDTSVPVTQVGDPVWPVALLFPRQGDWSEEDYLALDTTRLVELSDGCLEVLPMPSPFHQLIAQLLSNCWMISYSATNWAWYSLHRLASDCGP